LSLARIAVNAKNGGTQELKADAKHLSGRLKPDAAVGGIYAAVTFVILVLFKDNLALGSAIAAPAVILLYFLLGRVL
jgi:hypothetical protein